MFEDVFSCETVALLALSFSKKIVTVSVCVPNINFKKFAVDESLGRFSLKCQSFYSTTAKRQEENKILTVFNIIRVLLDFIAR